MLKVRVVPVLLLKEGRMIKTKRFRFYKDTGDPLKTVKVYDAQGADELVLLDISATVDGRVQWLDLITESAKQCFIPITVGGGLTSVEAARKAFSAGADRVSVSTRAMEEPGFINELAESFGRANVVVCIDAKLDSSGDYEVTTHSATRETGKDVKAWACEAAERGAGEILLHFVDRDGMMSGYDLRLLKTVADAVDVPVMALGGVGSLQDMVDGVIEGNASAVAAASIFHFTDQSPIKAHTYMHNKGVPVCLA
jgi:cyclase